MDEIRVGLIGYGLAGKLFHAPYITVTPGLRLASVATRRADEVRTEYPDAQIHADPDAVLLDPKIDLVVVATPNVSHFDLARRALENSKAVVVDKPMVVSTSEAQALTKLAAARGLFLSVFQNRRWDGDFLTLRNLIGGEVLGDIVSVESTFDRFRPEVLDRWREQPGPGSGVWWDMGPHLIDQAIELFGKPDSVFAELGLARVGARVTDNFRVVLRYAAMQVILGCSLLATTPRPRFTVRGSKGTFVSMEKDPQEDMLRAGRRPGKPDWALTQLPGEWTSPDGGRRKNIAIHPGDYGHFYGGVCDALRLGSANPVTPDSACAVINILELAEHSSRGGAEVACRAAT